MSGQRISNPETASLGWLRTPPEKAARPTIYLNSDGEEEAAPSTRRGNVGGGGGDGQGSQPQRSQAELEQSMALLQDVNRGDMVAAAYAAAPSAMARIIPQPRPAPAPVPLMPSFAGPSSGLSQAQLLQLMSMMSGPGAMPWLQTPDFPPMPAPLQQPAPAQPAPAPRAAPAPRRPARSKAKKAREVELEDLELELAFEDEWEVEEQPKKKRKSAPKKKPGLTEPVVEGMWTMDPTLPLMYRTPAGGSSKIAAMSLDGVICLDSLGRPYAGNAYDWQFAFRGVPDNLARLVRQGYIIAVLNNQGNVKGALLGKASNNARGKVDAILSSLERLHGVDASAFKVLLAPQQGEYRKPDIGMWQYFVSNCNGGVNIDMSQSFYVGCSPDDEEMAAAVGLPYKEAQFYFSS